ncbi:MAG: response regulator [Bacteroidota bacterium]
METKSTPLIFVVDDDRMFLKSLEHDLRQFLRNVRIKAFPSGEECLRNIDQRPDIVLLDYMLDKDQPGSMDGIKVLERIKSKVPDSTVIMMSAQDNMDVAVNTMKHGAFDYIIKNDRIFVRIHNAIKNVIHSLSVRKQMKDYRRMVAIFVAIIATVAAVAIYMQIFYPGVLER